MFMLGILPKEEHKDVNVYSNSRLVVLIKCYFGNFGYLVFHVHTLYIIIWNI